jgi:hypothetical protein
MNPCFSSVTLASPQTKRYGLAGRIKQVNGINPQKKWGPQAPASRFILE